MNDLIEILSVRSFILAQNIVNHMIIFCIQFALMNIKVTIKKSFLCSLIISLFYLIPIYSTFMFVFLNSELPSWVYSLLIFIMPPFYYFIYLVIKRIFNFSDFKSVIVMKNQILIHNMVVLTYMILNSAFVAEFGEVRIFKEYVFLGDLVSIVAIIAILLVVFYIVKVVFKNNNKHIIIPPAYTDKNIRITIIKIIAQTSVIYCILVFFRLQWIENIRNPLDYTTAFFYMLLIVGILLYLLYTILKLRVELDDWKMKATDTYISSLLNVNKEFQRIKHDFYNILQVYSSFFEIEDYEGVKKYHKSLFKTTKESSDFLSIIQVFRNRVSVYGLLESMSKKAIKAEVELSINKVCDITNVVITDIDLCRMLSIVIDNAIEAATISHDKHVNISFESKYENTVLIIVSNTTEDYVDTKLIFNDGYTTKQNHMGIGLTTVREILNSYDQCYFRTTYSDNQFTLILILASI